MKWIKLTDRLPNEKEQKDNWKFLVGNKEDDWTDTAYYNPNDKDDTWNNGECTVLPTHWQPLIKAPK